MVILLLGVLLNIFVKTSSGHLLLMLIGELLFHAKPKADVSCPRGWL